MSKKSLLCFLSLCLLASCSEPEAPKSPNKDSNFVQQANNPQHPFQYELAGQKIDAPYAWLKSPSHPDYAGWIEQQQKQTQEYFSKLEWIDVENMLQKPQRFHPIKHLYKYYYLRKLGVDGAMAIMQYDSLEENETSLIPLLPANISSISQLSLEPEGRFIAFEVKSFQKSYRWYIYDLANQRYSDHQLASSRHSSNLIWLGRHRIISVADQQLSYHNLLKSDAFDYPVFELSEQLEIGKTEADKKQFEQTTINANLSADGQYLVVQTQPSAGSNYHFWYYDFENPEQKFISLIKDSPSSFNFLANIEQTFYFQTKLTAPRGRIISISLDKPQRRNWKEVIAQSNAVLASAKLVNNKWLLQYRDNTRSQLWYKRLNGSSGQQISITPLSKLTYPKAQTNDSKLLISLETPFSPSQLATLDLDTLSLELLKLNQNTEAKDYHSEVAFYRSEDGSRIPITLISQTKIVQNGENKTLLLSHQGFGQLYDYQYQALLDYWLAQGNLVVLAHTRGSGAYGDTWHKAASGNDKDKGAEDLAGALEWLIDKNYSRTEGINLIAQKDNSPLFASLLNTNASQLNSVVFLQGYFDLLSNQRQTNPQWAQEFGFNANAKQVKNLLRWSPQQNLSSKNYPATLVIGEQEAQPYLAKLQNVQQANQPILLLATQADTDDNSESEESRPSELAYIINFLNAEN